MCSNTTSANSRYEVIFFGIYVILEENYPQCIDFYFYLSYWRLFFAMRS